MTTREQALAAFERRVRNDYHALGEVTPMERREVDENIVRAYLAQPEGGDVVVKAHEIIATLRRTLCDENAGDPGCPCLDCQDFDVVASALPPLPEEK